jgi:G3E family GTPase
MKAELEISDAQEQLWEVFAEALRDFLKARSRPGIGGPAGAHDVLRVKGFVNVPGRERRQVVQAVGDRLQQHFDRPWHAAERRETRLVVIGRKGLDRAAIMSALGALDG